MIKRNYYKVVRVFPDPSSYFYIKNETMNSGRITYYDSGWLSTVNVEYSFDKVNWIRFNEGFYLPEDSYVYFRNTSGTFCTNEYNWVFWITDMSISLGGDVRTLFNYTDVDSVTAIPAYGFKKPLYIDGGNITDISKLSFRGITSIGDYGLSEAFSQNQFTITKGVDLRDVTTIGESALNQLYSFNSNLTEVYAPNVSTWDISKAESWLSGVAPTGVVYKPSTLDIPTNNSDGIPSGWTTPDYPTK